MKRFLLPLVCAALAFGVASCSDDDTPGDPAGTVMLNMLDEHNGRTPEISSAGAIARSSCWGRHRGWGQSGSRR